MRKTETTAAYKGDEKSTEKYREAMYLALGIIDVEELELTETQLRAYRSADLYHWLMGWGYAWDVPLQAWLKVDEGQPKTKAPF